MKGRKNETMKGRKNVEDGRCRHVAALGKKTPSHKLAHGEDDSALIQLMMETQELVHAFTRPLNPSPI
jgi:hypothetical protein